MRSILLRLQGGLGNQLFQLLALRYLQQKHLDRNSDIFLGHLDKFYAKLSLNIESILNDEILINETNSITEFLLRSKISRILSRFSTFSLGRVEQLDKWDGHILDGYFQDIFNYSERNIARKEIAQIHNKVTAAVPPSDINAKDCAIHLRLTDFINSKRQREYLYSYRLPYIISSIKLLKEHYAIDRFFLFSDDPTLAKQFLAEHSVTYINDAFNISSLSVIEEFAFMSSFQTLICSNSTFSFWAALVGSPKLIVFPKIWDALKIVDEKVFQKNIMQLSDFSVHENQIIRN